MPHDKPASDDRGVLFPPAEPSLIHGDTSEGEHTASWYEHSPAPEIPLTQQRQRGELLADRYLLVEVLGSGGFGVVWKARDQLLGRDVALKISRHAVAGDDDLLQEARIVAGLGLPGLLPIFDVVCEGGHWFVVSELMSGGSLAQKLASAPPTCSESVRLVMELAETLHRLHQRGYFHRDVKPGNILFNPYGRPFVSDFGLAVSEMETLQQEPGLYGTVKYMSPEQAQGRPDLIDGRSDQFSLGVVLYLLLTKRQPFVDCQPAEYLRQIVERPARPLRSIDESIPPALERICLKMLEKKAGDRYSTLGDAAAALREFQSTVEPEFAPIVARRQPAWPWTLGALAVLFGVLVAIAAAANWGPFGLARLERGQRAPFEAVNARPAEKLVDVAPSEKVSEQPPAKTLFQDLSSQELIVGRTYPLLAREPQSLHGKVKDGIHFDAEREKLLLAAYGANVFQLGEIRQGSYTLRVEVRQEARWLGQAGIFWGLHPDPETPGGWQAQALLVQTGKGQDQQPTMRVLRKKMLVGKVDFTTVPPTVIESYAAVIPQVVPGRALQLEISIDGDRVESVRCSGDYLPALSSKELNASFGSEFYQGGFGIFAAQVSGATFENAAIRIDE